MIVKHQKQRRAYLRGIPKLPLARQQEMARAAKCDAVYEYQPKRTGSKIRENWLRGLRAESIKHGHEADEAWVADLRVLLDPKTERAIKSQMRALSAAINAVLKMRVVLVEARTGLKSTDGMRWDARVDEVLKGAAHQERSRKQMMTPRLARAARKQAMTAKWRSDLYAKDRDLWSSVWRDPKWKNMAEAQQHLPEELQSVSIRTLIRIFDGRRPKAK